MILLCLPAQFQVVLTAISAAKAQCSAAVTQIAALANSLAFPGISWSGTSISLPDKSYAAAIHFINNAMDSCDSQAPSGSSSTNPWYAFESCVAFICVCRCSLFWFL
jgi:hypothetical protein